MSTPEGDLLTCFQAALTAVDPRRLVQEALADETALEGTVYVAAFGKASAAMTLGAFDVLGERIRRGVVLVPDGDGARTDVSQIPTCCEIFRGAHPIPEQRNVVGARRLYELASKLAPDDVLLCLISGGGSALLTLPAEGVSLADIRRKTSSLLRAGADIASLNRARKSLELLKGGGLAEATPARCVGLVLSDVVGDRLDVIASGPLTSATSKARTRVIGSARTAAEAALAQARRLGYETHFWEEPLVGEAHEAGERLVRWARAKEVVRPACLAAVGETTVTVRGAGRGGRNLELALGAALALDGTRDLWVASFATDGVDGMSDAAGAVADGRTLDRARDLGLDARQVLAENDSDRFWRRLDHGFVVTGPTGTNVMDLQLVLRL